MNTAIPASSPNIFSAAPTFSFSFPRKNPLHTPQEWAAFVLGRLVGKAWRRTRQSILLLLTEGATERRSWCGQRKTQVRCHPLENKPLELVKQGTKRHLQSINLGFQHVSFFLGGGAFLELEKLTCHFRQMLGFKFILISKYHHLVFWAGVCGYFEVHDLELCVQSWAKVIFILKIHACFRCVFSSSTSKWASWKKRAPRCLLGYFSGIMTQLCGN